MGICILFTKSQQNLELVDLEMVEQDLDLEMVEKVQEHQDVHVYPRVWEGQDPHLLLDQDQVPHLLLDQDQVQPLLEVDQGQDQGQEKLQSPSQDQDLDQVPLHQVDLVVLVYHGLFLSKKLSRQSCTRSFLPINPYPSTRTCMMRVSARCLMKFRWR